MTNTAPDVIPRAMRLYVQAATAIERYGDERIWAEYFARMDGKLVTAPKVLTRRVSV